MRASPVIENDISPHFFSNHCFVFCFLAATAVPDSRAWGSKKSWFMGGDVRDNKIILSGSEDEAGAAALEEKEAMEIQKRHAAFMTEEDFMIPSSAKVFVVIQSPLHPPTPRHTDRQVDSVR